VSLKCTASVPSWNSLSSAAFESAKWKSIKNLAGVDVGDTDKTRWRGAGYDDHKWNTPAVSAEERFVDVPDGYTTIGDTSGDTSFPAWKFRYNHNVFGDEQKNKINVEAYIGCYVTKPSAPALSHRVGARAGATDTDTAIPLRRCAKMCQAFACKIPTHPRDEPAQHINVNPTSLVFLVFFVFIIKATSSRWRW
jgi:hypothetical protein